MNTALFNLRIKLGRFFEELPDRKYRKFIDQFIKNNPQHTRKSLCYSVVKKGQHYVQPTPHAAMLGLDYFVDGGVETDAPVIYGPAFLIISHETDDLVGVFPL